MSIIFRVAKEDEKERDALISLFKYAYDEPAPALEHFKKCFEVIYKEHYLGSIKNEIVTCLRCIPMEQNIRGVFKKCGGIGMVATYPEERRKGYCRDLMRYSYEKMHSDNIVVSNLTPFKDSFYMQFGYVNAKPHQFIEINPLWLDKWKTLPNGYRLKRMKISEGLKELRDCQEFSVSKFNGGVKRFDKRWEEIVKDSPAWLVIVYNSKNEIKGAMHYNVTGYGDQFFGEDVVGRMGRIGFFPKTLGAKHALFHYMYLHAEQLVKVFLPIYPSQDNFQSWIQGHIKTKIEQHFISMVRIITVETVFDKIPVPEANYGDINIEIEDPICAWNNGILKLWEEGGILHSKFYPHETLDAKITIEGLTALLYGTMTVEEVEYFDWMTNVTSEDKEILATWFPRKEYCCTEFF